ncbi:DoxX family protein [uncultured Spirosoma sp.]|uniref:DoxX family protein n=1 Tax=uncultured Spirosoma sp. TaxID=278208 RepID=UPI00258CA7EA|nr:DoxX family protein [uncultured Spirosoma sp.]
MDTSLFAPWRSTASALNASTLLLRLIFGGLMIPHGYAKLTHFAEYQNDFMNLLGLGTAVSLSLAIVAEFGCSILLVLGLFTRLALVPLIVTTLVIVFGAHGGEILGDGEHGFLYLGVYLSLLLTGPGQYSVDQRLFGRSASANRRFV